MIQLPLLSLLRLLFDVDVDINVDVKVAIQADVCIDVVEVDVYLDVDVGVCLGGDDVVLDRLLRDSRTVIIPASIVIIIILNTPHCHQHRAHSPGSQDNDLSLSQATELLRVVTARSQELQLPLVVAILDR